MKERKNVTWRVAEHPESKKINAWLDSQRHIQDSLANIVLHMIDRFGNENITDYQIQKKLYGETKGTPAESDKEAVQSKSNNDAEQKADNSAQINQSEEENNIYDGIDTDNL